nr:MAG: putative capsid protein [Arizlama virus]
MPRGYVRRSGARYGRLPRSYAKLAKSVYGNDSKMARRFPSSAYGRAYFLRGSNRSLNLFGPSAREASDMQKENRRDMHYRGRGMYTGGGEYEGCGGYKIGKALAKFGRGKFAQTLKNAALDRLSSGIATFGGGGLYTGQGEYTTNSLVNGSDEVPAVISSAADETGAVTVSRKEWVMDIYGPTNAFNVQGFAINPGIEQSFPWLSQIAQNYEEYELKQLIWFFKSTTTDIGSSTTGQCGTVVMCTNYNAGAALFSDKQIMMEYDGASSCKTTESMMHGVECDPDKLSGPTGYFVRSNNVVTGQDIKSYDHGIFQLAVANSPVGFQNQTIGELWVSYTVELRKPKFYVGRGLGISQDLFCSGGGETASLPLGTASLMLYGQANNIGCRIESNPATLPAGLTVASGQIAITFPASFGGTVEIRLLLDGFTTSGGWNGATGIQKSGNVATVSDIYATSSLAGRTPHFYVINNDAVGGTNGILIVHMKISPAANGLDNMVVLSVNPANITTAPGQTYLTIKEYNGGFSYKANNIGPAGQQSDAPILVDINGTPKVPV